MSNFPWNQNSLKWLCLFTISEGSFISLSCFLFLPSLLFLSYLLPIFLPFLSSLLSTFLPYLFISFLYSFISFLYSLLSFSFVCFFCNSSFSIFSHFLCFYLLSYFSLGSIQFAHSFLSSCFTPISSCF